MNDDADPEALAGARAAAMWEADEASRGLGMSLVDVAPGVAVVAMTVTRAMLNGVGTAHGGMIFSLADSAFAFACNTGADVAVASHAEITFVRPARAGERLTARASERVRFGRSGLYDVTVTGADGAIVAEFRGHARRIGPAPANEPEAQR